MTARYDYQVPYSYRGNLLHTLHKDEIPVWEENDAFTADMRIEWFEPGKVAKVLVLRDTKTNAAYPMYLDDLLVLIRTSVIANGVVSGTWRIKRTGRNVHSYTIVKVDS